MSIKLNKTLKSDFIRLYWVSCFPVSFANRSFFFVMSVYDVLRVSFRINTDVDAEGTLVNASKNRSFE